jgi:pyruvate dehydrogenase E2 component (dihydrolipoamide acetyltransferase)
MSIETIVETTPGQFEFRLPDLGEGVMEGEIVKWLIKAGDVLSEDQLVVEIMTDKATMEIPCPSSGTVTALTAKEGDIVPVGVGVFTFTAESKSKAIASTTVVNTPVAVAAGSIATGEQVKNGVVLASPSTRSLAKQLGLSLNSINGTGPSGRVTREDVHLAAEGGQPVAIAYPTQTTTTTPAPAVKPAATPIADQTGDTRVALKGLRRKIAEKMVQSAYTAPHVTTFDEVDMTALVALRAKLKPKAEAAGTKLSYMPFIMKACVSALKKFPTFNASLDETTQEIVLKKAIHLGFAAATDNGLMVPVVRNADGLSVLEISQSIQTIAQKTRDGKAEAKELSGSTFTVSNVGSVGGLFATPIITYPEVAILGVNQIQKRPVVVDGEMVIRDMMYLGISFDHRVIDGSEAVQFLQHIIQLLKDPEWLLLNI